MEQESLELIRILLADDELHMLDSLQTLMTHYGYQVDTALGGRAAIEKLNHNHYDLLLLDLRMPDVSGHDVMEYMEGEGIDTMTIVVSGETAYADVSRALRNGGYDYLKKPYAPEELMATVNNAVRKRRLENANKTMQRRLRKSEQLHRFIVNNSPDIIFMLDDQGCFSFLNNKIDAVLGYNKNDLLGKPVADLIDAEDGDKARFFFDNIDLDAEFSRTIEISLKHARSGRSRHYFELSVWPITPTEVELASSKQTYRIYGTARDITERKEAEAFINFQAYHDLLTRLPNRALFKDRLSVSMTQARRNNTKLAVMFLDLDRFKIVNDSLGHTVGDRLLQAVSVRLNECLRKGDTLSRFGGDEFTLLLPEVNSEAGAAIIAEKLIKALKEPFFLGEHEVYVGCSIGIVLFPEGGEDIEALIQNADAAMYHIKQRGKDAYAFYREEMSINTADRLYVERDIRRAIENDEFVVHFQPQINLEDGGLAGVEALIRWNHPTKGFIYPGAFIPIAEESRLIVEIDKWMLRTACREVRSWFRNGSPNIQLGVNFSPLFVEQPDFVECLLNTLKETDFPLDCFELEITENVILSDMDHTIDKLSQLSSAGVSIAIDDFGTGYSSLSYLQKFPIHTLKIDRAFVQNVNVTEDGACIVNAIVSMAQGLKLNIVAEGVETKQQLDYLKDLGCDQVQGFFIGAGMPAQELAAKYWLTNPMDNLGRGIDKDDSDQAANG